MSELASIQQAAPGSLLDLFPFEPAATICIDFETFYDQEYQLRKLTTEGYVRDPRFEVIGVGVGFDDRPPIWLEEAEFRGWVSTIDWSRVAVLSHKTHFDGLILAHHYGVKPGLWLCSLSMSRAINGTSGRSNNLDALTVKYGLKRKGEFGAATEGKTVNKIAAAKGKHRADFTPEEWLQYGEYCKGDVDACRGVFWHLGEGFPDVELWMIDTTVRMFTEPKFVLHEELLRQFITYERQRKAALLNRVEQDKSIVMSNDKFAALLVELGEDPHSNMKVTPQQMKKWKDAGDMTKGPTETFAFAKSDSYMQGLLEHPDDMVRWAAEARVALKSTINETRSERFLKAGAGGRPVPVMLNYYGAHTGRWCMRPESEVMTPQGWVRMDSYTGERILEWAPNGTFSWGGGTMNSFPYDGSLVRIDSEYVRGSFTPEHVLPRWTTTGSFSPCTAADGSGRNLRVPTTGVFADAPGVEISDAHLRLWVAIQADGYIEDPTNRPLRFKFRKERKIERLREILKEASIPWTEFDTLPERCISVARREVPEFLWSAKRFGWGLLNLDQRQRETFLEELRYWDASPESEHMHYTSTIKENADVVAAIAQISGLTANIYVSPRRVENPNWADLYEVTTRKNRKFAHVTSKCWGTEHYVGKVYCPTTQTGFFLVRSEGRVFVTGNSGGDRMNFQNLERTNKKKPERGVIRKSLYAPAGWSVVAADSGAIEARGVAWLAGHTELMEAFQQKRDIYSEFASEVYGRKVDRKKNPEDEIPGHVAKTAVLGLGYSMGWFKFAETLLKGPFGADPIQFTMKEAEETGVNLQRFVNDDDQMDRLTFMKTRLDTESLTIHCAVAQKVVYTWRNKNRPIVNLWATLGHVIKAMFLGQELTFGPGECMQTIRHGIVLPNGMLLKYPGLEEGDDGFTYLGGKSGKERTRIYGGSLTENVVQALARIIVAEQMLMIRGKYGYDIASMTHDEVVVLVPNNEAERAKARMLTEMKTPPAWALGWPLTAEGGYASCYGEAKS